MVKITVKCPKCGGELEQSGKFLFCPKCHTTWLITEISIKLEEVKLWSDTDGDELIGELENWI